MATTTPNFGWDIPQSTDLVKDGATAIAALGNDIDAALVDLKGGTTGQILSKNSNTDLDYTWITSAGDIEGVTAGTGLTGGGTTGTVTLSLSTPVAATNGGTAQTTYTTGDVLYASASNTLSKLAIGSTDQVLKVTGGVPAWGAAPVSTQNFTLLNSGGTALTGAATITVSSLSGYNQLLVVIDQASVTSANPEFWLRINADTGSNYNVAGFWYTGGVQTTYGNDTKFILGKAGASSADKFYANMLIDGANATGYKRTMYSSVGNGSSNEGYFGIAGFYKGTSVISSISIITGTSGTNFDGGTIYIYGA